MKLGKKEKRKELLKRRAKKNRLPRRVKKLSRNRKGGKTQWMQRNKSGKI